MPRTIWEWLEIEETADRNLIRKAYARQSKKYHPEDAPEEAKHLREAYKAALARADGKNKAVLPKKDPEAVCEEILEVIEDGADKDSRNGSGSREGTRRESHRESRTASEEGERYNCPEEGKEAASKAGRESLRESRSVSEESYQYPLPAAVFNIILTAGWKAAKGNQESLKTQSPTLLTVTTYISLMWGERKEWGVC